MTYTLTVTEINTKAAKYQYTITDENGNVISTRKSDRQYVACTIDGKYYFGRFDLVGKGDHGKSIMYNNGYRMKYNRRGRGRYEWYLEPTAPILPQVPVAYLKP